MVEFAISQHAAERYIERVEPSATMTEARAAIRSHAWAIEAAIRIGARSIRLASGHRIILAPADAEVVTITPVQPKISTRGFTGRRTDFRASRGYAWKEQGDE